MDSSLTVLYMTADQDLRAIITIEQESCDLTCIICNDRIEQVQDMHRKKPLIPIADHICCASEKP